MPTKLDRVQVLFKKDLFKKLKLIARIERRSLSSMVGSIVEDAIKSKKYQSLLSKAKVNDLMTIIADSKSVINEILQSQISNEFDFDSNSKLKKLDEMLSLISESKNETLVEDLSAEDLSAEDLSVEDLFVEDALKPHGLIEEFESNTDYKIKKMKEMLSQINKKKI
tara:strand:- start:1267 stop:1767 length:501 start_codon:yes stop_codon:yes gene_type:complete